MKQMAGQFPPGLRYEVSYDATRTSSRCRRLEVLSTLVEAIGLVLLVVFLFLGTFRATLIPMLAVPCPIIGTFAIFVPLGFSINTLTLFGLVLAIGIVVDDAIVVVEAVEHHIEHGLAPFEATKQAMAEVSGPVVAIALVLCAVFVPVAFLGGITGQLYRQFALTLSISVLLSALVALTLTPALCVMILRPRPTRGPLGAFLRGFARWLRARVRLHRVRRPFDSRVALSLIILASSAWWPSVSSKRSPRGSCPMSPGRPLRGAHSARRGLHGADRRPHPARGGVPEEAGGVESV